ncbi:MAG: [protein-PII] uridylyltransferase, partial [Sphingomonadaceae bacterium]
VDLLFLAPARPGPAAEAAITAILHQLWDWGLKLGHATRSAEETIRAARADLTIRTSLVEARFLAGDRPAFDALFGRFRREMVAGQQARFVAEKLEERAARHRRMGDSRYLNEPNVKEGKGGLRDLHTLFWIGKFVHQTVRQEDLVRVGLLSPAELRAFRRAEEFFWTVRMQLHLLSCRAEERLTFDVQPELARRLRYADRPGAPGVERFMRHYYLHARTVGALTGVFLAQLEEQFGKRSWVPAVTRRPARLGGLAMRRGRIAAPDDGFFRADPVRLLELFRHAADEALEIDAGTLRQAARDADLIDERVRQDPRACAAFLSVLTSPRDPEKILRWMNECGVFGRFMPEFGRVVARPQFDMYHHYTVDEHTIRALGLLARVESGALSADYPLASAIAHTIAERAVLYLAVLFHDIAKGRGGDHSELGSHIARRWCPRFGLSEGETETVAWLVRHHLMMSNTAFKRDLSDPETVERFARAVGSAERLRLLTVLTTIDISAVGPGIWNPWKARLIAQLFELSEERLRPGFMAHGRAEAVAARQAALGQAMGWDAARLAAHAVQFEDSYWLAETPQTLTAHARLLTGFDGTRPAVLTEPDPGTGATRVIVAATDAPGLFAAIAGAIALAGATIVD